MSSAHPLIENHPSSVAQLFLQRAMATPDRRAYTYPLPGQDAGAAGREEWAALTWAQTAQRVKAIAAGLKALGINTEDRVAIASGTRIEWILADLGVQCAGAATTTVYPSTNADETAFILADSESRVLFAENTEQLAKVLTAQARLPELTHVFLFDFDAPAEEARATGLHIAPLSDLEQRGTRYLAEHPEAIDKTVAAITKEQLATLVYTSGTTGRPKGVLLTQEGLAHQAVAQAASGLISSDDVQYLWLPLAHVFGKALLSGQIHTGHVMAVDGRIDRIARNLQAIRPTTMACVPRIYEKVYNQIAAKARANGGIAYRVFRWAATVARTYAQAAQARRQGATTARIPLFLKAKHTLADRLVYAKVRAAFGGRLRIAVSGSAALAPEIAYFFSGAGIPILEGYGLTEISGCVTVNRKNNPRIGTVGTSLPGFEVRIADDGEILLRGPGLMRGYHRLPDQTAEALDADGWLHTGDIGTLDQDGYLSITDRKKDLFKTSGGKYIAPSEIEGKFKATCPFVSNIVVIGNNRNFCTALITLDEAAIMPWAAEHGLAGRSYADIAASDEARELIEGFVQRVNGRLQRWQTIKRFTLLPRDLDIEHGELTPSLKVKRSVVEAAFADAVARMYRDANEP